MMGDYYQITTNWTNARTEWWNMLQRVMDTDGSVDAILADSTNQSQIAQMQLQCANELFNWTVTIDEIIMMD